MASRPVATLNPIATPVMIPDSSSIAPAPAPALAIATAPAYVTAYMSPVLAHARRDPRLARCLPTPTPASAQVVETNQAQKRTPTENPQGRAKKLKHDYPIVSPKKDGNEIKEKSEKQSDDTKIDKSYYNTLMYKVLQLNEKLKLEEAKQREALENSKKKLKVQLQDENHTVRNLKSNSVGQIYEKVDPAVLFDTRSASQPLMQCRPQASPPNTTYVLDTPGVGLPPTSPNIPLFMSNLPLPLRGQLSPTTDVLPPRNFNFISNHPIMGHLDKRDRLLPFDPCMAIPPMPVPQVGMYQGECPLEIYQKSVSPPPLGATGIVIPSTDFKILEYIDQDPVKTTEIDGVSREIRFYGEIAIVMMDWDDPREIKFLPGCRRVTFDNKDSVVISFNDGYKQLEIDDQVFEIKFGAPTRELYINGRWFEGVIGGQPIGVILDGKPKFVHLEGPLPHLDIGKEKRTDLVAGKINLIVNDTLTCPVFLDAKVQKFMINGRFFTIRFADSLRTVLINEQPFKVEYGDLPKPLFVGKETFLIRFSALPQNIKPGQVQIANMEGSLRSNVLPTVGIGATHPIKADQSKQTNNIPGLGRPTSSSVVGNINVNDLYSKLGATGMVSMSNTYNNKMQCYNQKGAKIGTFRGHRLRRPRPPHQYL